MLPKDKYSLNPWEALCFLESEIFNALIKAGIKIDHFNEYPFSPHSCFDVLEEREKGRFYLTQSGNDVPLVYTIKGTKID